MLGSLILYLKGLRIMMFQLSGFYYSSDASNHLVLMVFVLSLPLSGELRPPLELVLLLCA